MAKRKNKYTAAERRAYNIGYGAGLCGVKMTDMSAIPLVDSRQGLGQDPHLISMCRKGMMKGNKDKISAVPFERRNFKRKW